MIDSKNKTFAKRTAVNLFPLLSLIFFNSFFNSRSYLTSTKITLNGLSEESNPFSASSLASLINKPLPPEIIDEGDVWKIPSLDSNLRIENLNPFHLFSLGESKEYSYQNTKIGGYQKGKLKINRETVETQSTPPPY